MIFLFSVMFACTQFSCTRAEVSQIERFKKNPSEVRKRIEDLDSLARLELVMELVETYPEDAAQLCPLLSGDARNRCISISERPHLWSKKKEEHVATKRKETADTDCTKGAQFRLCLDEEVQLAIRKGNIDRVKGLCAHIDQDKWYSECLFSAAEHATRHRGAHGYSEGVELCMEAGSFSGNCQNHLIMMLAQKSPPAYSTKSQDWGLVESSSNAVRAAWSWRDRTVMEENQERLWSEALGIAYTGVKPVTGDPQDILPSQYRPHIHSALSRRLLQIDPPRTHKLSTWVELAQRCMEKRAEGKVSRDVVSRFQAAADLWDSDIQEKSVAYMATSRRLVSDDAQIDLYISILEGAARIPPAYEPLLEEGLVHSHPLVQKTAQRLLKKIRAE